MANHGFCHVVLITTYYNIIFFHFQSFHSCFSVLYFKKHDVGFKDILPRIRPKTAGHFHPANFKEIKEKDYGIFSSFYGIYSSSGAVRRGGNGFDGNRNLWCDSR